MIIVIGLIMILATATIVTIDPVSRLKTSRDGQRKADIKILQSGLELYRAGQGSYAPQGSNFAVSNCPTASPTSLVDDCTTGLLADADTVYIQNVPKDPKGSDYYYCTDTVAPCSAPAGGYSLYACVESSANAQGTLPVSGFTNLNNRCPTTTFKGYIKVTNP